MSAESRLGGEELRVREAVRSLARSVLAPAADSVDAESRFPAESFRALSAAGLAGLLVPSEYGGSGHTMLAYVAAMEEIAAACGSTSTVYMTQMHAAYPILAAGNEAQRRRWLPALCDGTALGSLCVTEPEAGSDVASMRTTARREGDAYLLNGGKTFITTGDRATTFVVFATVDAGAGRDGITPFVVERGTDGLVSGPPMHKLGQRGSTTAEVFLDDCRVPDANRLGREGAGWDLTMQSVGKSRLSAAAQGVGLARGAFEAALAWARERDLLRGSGGYSQEVQFELAEASTQIAAARALLHDTAAAAAGPGDTEVSMAKLFCTDCGMNVATRLVELMDADGDRREFRVERFMRDAKVTQIYDGTNQIQRMLIARSFRAPRPGQAWGRDDARP